MLTNGFAIFKGESAPSLARRARERVRRYATRVLVDAGDGFIDFEGARLSGKRSVALAYSVEEGGRDGAFPLVHGFADGIHGEDGGGTPREGEFSLVGKERGDDFFAYRDGLGTRGLWVVPARVQGAGSLASDHRLLGGRRRLLPPGTAYRKGVIRREGWNLEKPSLPESFEGASRRLATLVDESVRKRVKGRKRVAVSFSGGLDSSILAMVASKYTEVILCSAYAPGSRDERQTTRSAELLGLRLEAAVMREDEVLERSKGIDLPSDEATLMDRALWCIYSTTSELGGRLEARMILLGQLADELFGGYKKYAVAARADGAEAAEKMMSQDVKACADKGFLRDEAACSTWAEARFPFAESSIASFAKGLPLDYKIRDGQRKAVLRAAALELGLPEEIANAPKKAAQFSSGFAKLLKNHY